MQTKTPEAAARHKAQQRAYRMALYELRERYRRDFNALYAWHLQRLERRRERVS